MLRFPLKLFARYKMVNLRDLMGFALTYLLVLWQSQLRVAPRNRLCVRS